MNEKIKDGEIMKTFKNNYIIKIILLNTCFLLVFLNVLETKSQAAGKISTDSMKKAAKILKETKSSGGLVVHLGSGDGKLTAALGASGSDEKRATMP